MKVRIHDADIRLRLSEDDLHRLSKGLDIRSVTPMMEGAPLGFRLAIDHSYLEPSARLVQSDVEFRLPFGTEIEALLSRDEVGLVIDLETSDGPLHLSIERDLGRGGHLGGDV